MPDPDFASPPSFETIGVVNYVPSGACTLPNVVLKSTNVTGPGLYQCVPNDDTYTAGTWQKVGDSNLSGTLTPGVYPIASAAHTLVDGTIDYGVTAAGSLSIINPGTGGLLIEESGAGSGISIIAKGELFFGTDGSGTSTGILIENDGPFGTRITNTGTGGMKITDTGGYGILIDPTGTAALSAGNTVIGGVIVPGILYSAAEIALPDPTLTPGGKAVVSDATANVYGTAYASGGGLIAPVYSDGTAWNMG